MVFEIDMQPPRQRVCPGCGLTLPASDGAFYEGYYNTSPECWTVYTGVLATEYGNPAQVWQVHQLTVDTYALQHAGGGHPDKSIGVHLAGLYLVFERGLPPTRVAPQIQRLASRVQRWPRFAPPASTGSLTVKDVAQSGSPTAHAERVREWARTVWDAWSGHHAAVADLVDGFLPPC